MRRLQGRFLFWRHNCFLHAGLIMMTCYFSWIWHRRHASVTNWKRRYRVWKWCNENRPKFWRGRSSKARWFSSSMTATWTTLSMRVLRNGFDSRLEPVAFDVHIGWLLTWRAQVHFAAILTNWLCSIWFDVISFIHFGKSRISQRRSGSSCSTSWVCSCSKRSYSLCCVSRRSGIVWRVRRILCLLITRVTKFVSTLCWNNKKTKKFIMKLKMVECKCQYVTCLCSALFYFCNSCFIRNFLQYACFRLYHSRSNGVWLQVPNIKWNLCYTRDITSKRAASTGLHVCGLAPGQHSSGETQQQGRRCVDLTCPAIKPQTSRTDCLISTPTSDHKFLVWTQPKFLITETWYRLLVNHWRLHQCTCSSSVEWLLLGYRSGSRHRCGSGSSSVRFQFGQITHRCDVSSEL